MTSTGIPFRFRGQTGFSLVEVTVTLVVMSLLLGSFAVVASTAFETADHVRSREALTRDAAFAMERMVSAARDAPALMLPLVDNPATAQDEALREQRNPPAPGDEDRSAVLAVRLAPQADRNADGIPDADNDGDGRLDEDPGGDITNDAAAGIAGIDDDHDGSTDENPGSPTDDDEDGGPADEDAREEFDNDGDASVDEDPPADLNGDGQPGLAGVDDDGDGQTDEGSLADDDEDGLTDEDWYDPVVFYMVGSSLLERQPFPADISGDAAVTGRDYIETTIADNVTLFRIERLSRPRADVVDITLELSANGHTVSLNTRIRVGERT